MEYNADCGVEDERVEKAMEFIGEYSRRRTGVIPSASSYQIGRYIPFSVELQIGEATIFIIYERIVCVNHNKYTRSKSSELFFLYFKELGHR